MASNKPRPIRALKVTKATRAGIQKMIDRRDVEKQANKARGVQVREVHRVAHLKERRVASWLHATGAIAPNGPRAMLYPLPLWRMMLAGMQPGKLYTRQALCALVPLAKSSGLSFLIKQRLRDRCGAIECVEKPNRRPLAFGLGSDAWFYYRLTETGVALGEAARVELAALASAVQASAALAKGNCPPDA